jgi:hypothetical protein
MVMFQSKKRIRETNGGFDGLIEEQKWVKEYIICSFQLRS